MIPCEIGSFLSVFHLGPFIGLPLARLNALQILLGAFQ